MFEQYSGVGLEINAIYILFSIDKDDIHVKLCTFIWNIKGFESRPDTLLFVSGKKTLKIINWKYSTHI
jgi:hypothetical protein